MAEGTGRLAGKSAVVTGAAAGIGRATAIVFAREGARLVVNDIKADALHALRDELAAGGAQVEAIIGDVSIEADSRAMIRAAVEAYGRLDVLVATPGSFRSGTCWSRALTTGTASSPSTAAACS